MSARNPLPALTVARRALGGAALFVWSVLLTVLVGLGDCGGDGGSPYAAPASARGHACAFFNGGGAWLMYLAPVTMVVFSWLFVEDQRVRTFIAGVAVLAPVLTVVFIGTLNPECTSDTLRAACNHY